MAEKKNRDVLLRLGTRGSPLALAQAREVRAHIVDHAPALSEENIEIVVIKTTGDRVRDRALSEIGGKGLFIKEIEDALLNGDIDVAVHSMKDVPSVLPPGLHIPAVLLREDPRDAFISPAAASLRDLPRGAIIGTASLRRASQARRLRPDLEAVTLRGNVETRLRKLTAGEVQATFLAVAGLKRLGRMDAITDIMAIDDMVPAVAQGAIGVECRLDDARAEALLAPLNDAATSACVAAERRFLAVLEGSCHMPIAGYATLEAGAIALRARVLSAAGDICFEAVRSAPVAEAADLGAAVGHEIIAAAGERFLAALAG